MGLNSENKSDCSSKTTTTDPSPPPPVDVSRLDIRVGQITFTQHHILSNKIYVNHVLFDADLEKPSISRLKKHYSRKDLKDKLVVVVCNVRFKLGRLRKHYSRKDLKDKLVVVVCNVRFKVKKFISECFILFAETEDKAELLVPPPDAKAGTRVYVPDYPFKPLKRRYISPKKEGERVLREIVKEMRVDCEGHAEYRGVPLLTKELGFLTTQSLRDCPISI